MRNKKMKVFKLLIIGVFLIMNFITGLHPVSAQASSVIGDVNTAVQRAHGFLDGQPMTDDWDAFARVRSGASVSREEKLSYYNALKSRVQRSMSVTDLARSIIGAVSVGADPTDIGGVNLVESLVTRNTGNANNALIFTLIAVDTLNFDVSSIENATFTRDELIQRILNNQRENGSWANDVDMTGMAMTALAPYNNRAEVNNAIENAAAHLSSVQRENGGFNSWGTENSNSAAQALMGLAANGIDPTGEAFTQNGNNVVTALLNFQLENGGFRWRPTDQNNNGMALQQALYSLAQYTFFREGRGSIYDFVNNPVSPLQTENADKSELLALISEAEAIENNNYTDESWQNFLTALANASEIAQREAATQAEVDNAWVVLNEAIHNLEKLVEEEAVQDTITVSFEVNGRSEVANRQVIVDEVSVEIEQGKTAAYVIEKVLNEKGIDFINRNGNYIAMIGGLAEFDGGEFSGWLYSVNGVIPSVGINEFILEDNDSIVMFYIDDFREIDWGGGSTPPNHDGDTDGNSGNGSGDDSNNDSDSDDDSVEIPQEVQEAIENGVQKILSQGRLYTDWETLAVMRSGIDVPEEMQQGRLDDIVTFLREANRITATDYARTIIALLALGQDPENIDGRNLIEELYELEVNAINGKIFSLIALDTKQYEIPESAPMQREQLIEDILSLQHSDGGWSLLSPTFVKFSSSSSDPDITGMALTALAPYSDLPKVQNAINNALNFLSEAQTGNGGFVSFGNENSNSISQVLMGLSINNIDPTGEDFSQNGTNVVDALLSFQLENGGFRWLRTDTANNSMALEQAVYSLVQYQFYLEGNGSIFDFTINPVEDSQLVPGLGSGQGSGEGNGVGSGQGDGQGNGQGSGQASGQNGTEQSNTEINNTTINNTEISNTTISNAEQGSGNMFGFPKTGDSFSAGSFILSAAISMLALVSLVLWRKKIMQ